MAFSDRSKKTDTPTVESGTIMVDGKAYDFFNTTANPFLLMQVPYNKRGEALQALQERYPDFTVEQGRLGYRKSEENSTPVNIKFIFTPKPSLTAVNTSTIFAATTTPTVVDSVPVSEVKSAPKKP